MTKILCWLPTCWFLLQKPSSFDKPTFLSAETELVQAQSGRSNLVYFLWKGFTDVPETPDMQSRGKCCNLSQFLNYIGKQLIALQM